MILHIKRKNIFIFRGFLSFLMLRIGQPGIGSVGKAVWSHTLRQWQRDWFWFWTPLIPACWYMEEIGRGCHAATKRPACVAPEVNRREMCKMYMNKALKPMGGITRSSKQKYP